MRSRTSSILLAVAAIVPCICGNKVEAISSVVEYSVDAKITADMMLQRCAGVRLSAYSLSDMRFNHVADHRACYHKLRKQFPA